MGEAATGDHAAPPNKETLFKASIQGTALFAQLGGILLLPNNDPLFSCSAHP